MQKGSKPEVNSENFKCYTTFKVVQSEIVRGCPSSPIFNERELLELRQNQWASIWTTKETPWITYILSYLGELDELIKTFEWNFRLNVHIRTRMCPELGDGLES